MLNEEGKEVTAQTALEHIVFLIDRVRKALDIPPPERESVLKILRDQMREAVATFEAIVEQEEKRDDLEGDDETPEPMHPAAKKFLEVVFEDVTVEGCTRRIEFQDEPDGSTSVLLVAPTELKMPTIALGFPVGWWPPSEEEWDESFREEMEPEMQEMVRWMTDSNRPGIPSEAKREEDRKNAN